MNKNLIIGLALILVFGAVVFVALRPQTNPAANSYADILSFQDCADAGFPIMESFPRQCRVPDGRTYAEEVPRPEDKFTYTNASEDLIKPESPLPGSVTGKDFKVLGEARGYWFFEASFPVTILDKDGKVLVQHYAMATDEWMTENFVHYRADIKIPESYIGPATVILHKDNPSGLPENDASISYPITIEY